MAVVRIGQFAGGSFGRHGDPNAIHEYFADDRDLRSISICDVIAFRTQREADVRAEELDEAERASRVRNAAQEQAERDAYFAAKDRALCGCKDACRQLGGMFANILEEIVPGIRYRVSMRGGRVVIVDLSCCRKVQPAGAY